MSDELADEFEPQPPASRFGLTLHVSSAESVEDDDDDIIQVDGQPPIVTQPVRLTLPLPAKDSEEHKENDSESTISPFKFRLSMAGISVEDEAPMIAIAPIITVTSTGSDSSSESKSNDNDKGTDLERRTAAKLTKSSLGVDMLVSSAKRASYEVTQEGTLKTNLFHIGRSGFARSAVTATSTSTNSHTANVSPANRPHLDISESTLMEMSLLGRGAGGKVLKSFHRPTLTIIALKCIDVSDKTKRAQLLKELKELDTDYCPNIVAFYGAYYVDRTFSVKLGLEYMNRGSLQAIIHEYGAINELALSHCFKQVLLGLHHLHHNKKLHRDIKPGNILINHFGEAKLSDFGIIAELSSSMAKCGTFIGTMIYMSPERLTSEAYSYPADVWSLGLTVIAIATGAYPLNVDDGYWGLVMHFNTQPSPSLPPNTPTREFSVAFRDFVDKMLVKEPAKRWTTSELLEHPWIVNGCEAEEALSHWPPQARMFEPDPIVVDKQRAERLERQRKFDELEFKRKLKATNKQKKLGSGSSGASNTANTNATSDSTTSGADSPSATTALSAVDAKNHHQHRRKQAITKFHPVGLAHLQAEANQQQHVTATQAKKAGVTDLYGESDDEGEESDDKTAKNTGKLAILATSSNADMNNANTNTAPLLPTSPALAPASVPAQPNSAGVGVRARKLSTQFSSSAFLGSLSSPQHRQAQPSVDFNLVSPTRANRHAQVKVVNGQISLAGSLPAINSNGCGTASSQLPSLHARAMSSIPQTPPLTDANANNDSGSGSVSSAHTMRDRASSSDTATGSPALPSLQARQQSHRRSPSAMPMSASATISPSPPLSSTTVLTMAPTPLASANVMLTPMALTQSFSAPPIMPIVPPSPLSSEPRRGLRSRKPSMPNQLSGRMLHMKLPAITSSAVNENNTDTGTSTDTITPTSASASSSGAVPAATSPSSSPPTRIPSASPPLRGMRTHRSGSISASFSLGDLPPSAPAHLATTPTHGQSFTLASPIHLSPKSQRDLSLLSDVEKEDLKHILESLCESYQQVYNASNLSGSVGADSKYIDSPMVANGDASSGSPYPVWLPDDDAVSEDLARIADQAGIRLAVVAHEFRKLVTAH